MTIRYIEVRNYSSWNEAAYDIIKKLKEAGVQQGQVISIDTHNNGKGEAAIMSAMWDDTIKGRGPLSIGFSAFNETYSWNDFYTNAASVVSTKRPEDLISITGSCNVDDWAVLYVFYYHGPAAPVHQQIHYCEARSIHSWKHAAEQLVSNLKNKGAKAGQIISIDAHSNGADEEAILHAFWNSSLPAHGDLNIEFSATYNGSWESHYRWASTYIESSMKKIFGVTSSINVSDAGVTFVFCENDAISEVKFFIDQGKIAETKPLTLATLSNTNRSDLEQEMNFSYEESISDTSTFEHEFGVSITVGMEFSTGVPFIGKGKISTEISTSYSHKWGTSTETNKRGVSAVKVKSAPKTKVVCQFRASKSTLDVPYVVKLKSNRESSGTWKGVDVWNITSSYTSEKLRE